MKPTEETFLDFYNKTIAPQLAAIDLLLKTKPGCLNTKKAAALLSISEEEVSAIMAEENIKKLDPHSFFLIMKKGSSEICRLFNRELRSGTPLVYSPADISYIYNIDIDIVFDACKKIGISSFDRITLPILFSQLSCSGTKADESIF